MYKIIGGDGKEYGPVSAAEIRAWLAQGRLNAQSRVKPEGAVDWLPLSELPEFKDLLAPASAPPPIPVASPPAVAKVSGLAIASLVLGILGLVTFGLTGIVGIVLGIIALVKVGHSQGRLKGSGLAIAGICVSGFMLLILPVMAAMLLPALAKAKQRAQAINCMNNVKQLNLALIMYASDHGDRLPPADQWCDLIRPYTGGSTAMFHCPAQPPGRCSYALNASLAGDQLPGQVRTTLVLLYGSAEGWNQSGNPADALPHEHGKAFTVGFADGHVEIMRPQSFHSRFGAGNGRR
jgi:prepilin-type processing-associated H-X9-DG protein